MDSSTTGTSSEQTVVGGHFLTTHWSLVLQAGQSFSPEAGRALEELCRAYWYPLYVYARRRGVAKEDAEDLTQAFFERLIERRWLSLVKPAGGRFRSFLLTSFQHFMRDEWQKARAAKRGGGVALSLELLQAGERFAQEPADRLSADQLFARRWAFEVLEKALERLRDESVGEGKAALFDLILPSITETPEDGFYESVAARVGMSAGAVSVSAHRLRIRYRGLVRDEIARTVASPMDVEDELRELMDTLRNAN